MSRCRDAMPKVGIRPPGEPRPHQCDECGRWFEWGEAARWVSCFDCRDRAGHWLGYDFCSEACFKSFGLPELCPNGHAWDTGKGVVR